MKIELKTFLIIFGILCVLFFGFLLFSAKRNFEKNIAYEFSGVVATVSYDVKGIPTVTIDKKKYYLSAGYNFNFYIEKGDVLKKKKGSTTYTLIKQKTGKIISFNN